MLALSPVRGARESLEQVLAEPDLASDMIVIVGDETVSAGKRATYRALFAALGRARRPVLWVPGPIDRALEDDLRRAYETAEAHSPTQLAPILLFTPGRPPSDLGDVTDEILNELLATFKPGLAARVERPALYVLRDHGGSEWVEV
jgi:hypothetical protein